MRGDKNLENMKKCLHLMCHMTKNEVEPCIIID